MRLYNERLGTSTGAQSVGAPKTNIVVTCNPNNTKCGEFQEPLCAIPSCLNQNCGSNATKFRCDAIAINASCFCIDGYCKNTHGDCVPINGTQGKFNLKFT